MSLNPSEFRKIPDWLISSQWINKELKTIEGEILRPRDYGSNTFHGRTHPAIAYMSVIRFTEEGDTVYVPFAGSGTEIDICKKLKRKFIAIDLTPTREDILEGDATAFITQRPVKLIIAHPPYMDVIVYSKKETDLSKSGEKYIKLVEICVRNFYSCLCEKGKLVVIIGSVYKNKEEIPLDYIWYKEAKKVGFRLIGRIVRDFGETKGRGNTANLWKYRLLKWDRFRFENDFVFEKGGTL